jgi:hypothetical protein
VKILNLIALVPKVSIKSKSFLHLDSQQKKVLLRFFQLLFIAYKPF